VVHPQISATVFAIASGVGLFRSTNGADSWEYVQPPAAPVRALALKPGSPETMLAGNAGALYESLDGGNNWQQLFTATVGAIAYAPSAPNRVYVVADGAVRMSNNGGHSWYPPGGGLPEAPAHTIVVHPITDTLVLMGTENGHIFRTEDAGDSWEDLDAGLLAETVRKLLIDPHAPNRVYAIGWHGGNIFHRSLNGGEDWEAMTLAPAADTANDLAVHPGISGTLYSMTCLGVFSSTDAGGTWTQATDIGLDCMWAIGLDPVTGLPRYGGGGTRGVLRSEDGGLTWEVATEGINALQPIDISASATNPEQIYVAASSAGGFASADAGQSWQLGVAGIWTDISAASADPVQSCVGYLGSMGPGQQPNTGVGCVYKTTDCGQTWEPHYFAETPSVGEIVYVVAVDPHDPDTLFAGGVRSWFDTDADAGMVYRSTDGGINWTEVDVGHPLSDVVSIVFDPLVTDTLYIATGAVLDPGGMSYLPRGAVYKSEDGGASWDPQSNGLSGLPIEAMVIDPSDSNVLYLGVYEDPEWSGPPTNDSGVFKTTDGGGSWYATNTGLGSHNITSLFVDPLETRTVYAGTRWGGLYRSRDGGETWSRASGPFTEASIFCLSGGSMQERTIVYVGTAGGVSAGAVTMHSGSIVSTQEVLGAGVYQQTIDHRRQTEIYLPLVFQSRKNGRLTVERSE